MKKVSIINFHFAHNYGAVLQCLAMQTVLEKKRCRVTVIDYRPYYQEQYYARFPNPFKSAYWRFRCEWSQPLNKRLFRAAWWFFCTLKGYKNFRKRCEMKKAFEPFVKRNLHLTKIYNTYTDIKNCPPVSDLYICGSDQLWNPKVTSGLDPAYYLAFGNKDTLRIAYAVSPSNALDTNYFHKDLSSLLTAFTRISLREEEKKADLEKIAKKSITVCIDPTLLLDASDYCKFESPIDEKENFILVYAFKENDDYRIIETARLAKEKLGFDVVDISFEKIQFGFDIVNKKAVTPGQFLSYFKKAQYVITNSFHGTAFSIIYKKDFLSIAKEGTAGRMVELLSKVGLRDCLIEEQLCTELPNIDYINVEKLIAKYKKESQQFIDGVLENNYER